MRSTLTLILISFILSSIVVGCGGVDDEQVVDPLRIEVSSTTGALDGHHGGDGGGFRLNRAWSCSAGVEGGGPLFNEIDCDLERAMDYAVATCSRRFADALCSSKGCRFIYVPGLRCAY